MANWFSTIIGLGSKVIGGGKRVAAVSSFWPVILVVGGLLITSGTGLYFYVGSLRSDLHAAVEAQQQLKDSIDAKTQQINSINAALGKQKTINKNNDDRFDAADREKAAIADKLAKFTASVNTADPKITEAKINQGTIYALRCNEIVTGASLKPEDDTNNVCPDLIKSRKAGE